MGFTPEQIKGRVKSVAKQNNADARTLMRIYMMERFLEESYIKSKTVLRLRQKTSVFPFPPTRAFSGWNAGRNLLKIRNQIENPNLNRNSKKRSIGSSISLKKAI